MRRATAMGEALRLQRQAARQGFDWEKNDLEPLWRKLREEIGELREVTHHPRKAQDELGDLLFMVINLARYLGLKPEAALRAANRKFQRRYGYILRRARRLPPRGDPRRLPAMERLWNEAKRRGL